MKVLLEGRPGVGKTTLMVRLADLLRAADVPLAGFLTREIRQGGRRTGFALETLAGEEGVLAHVELPGPPRVGKYGVDLQALERLAVPALLQAPPDAVVLVDELGKMELASPAFRKAVEALFSGPLTVVATVHSHPHPLTDALKRLPTATLVRVTTANRDGLPARLASRLLQ